MRANIVPFPAGRTRRTGRTGRAHSSWPVWLSPRLCRLLEDLAPEDLCHLEACAGALAARLRDGGGR
jgi:hypothetical protein